MSLISFPNVLQASCVASASRKPHTVHRPPPTRFARPLLTIFLFLLTAHCLLPTLFAQSSDPVDIVKIDTDLVNLNVSVFNKTPRNLLTLAQKDFAVLD